MAIDNVIWPLAITLEEDLQVCLQIYSRHVLEFPKKGRNQIKSNQINQAKPNQTKQNKTKQNKVNSVQRNSIQFKRTQPGGCLGPSSVHVYNQRIGDLSFLMSMQLIVQAKLSIDH